MEDSTCIEMELDESSRKIVVNGFECDDRDIYDFFSGIPEEDRGERFLMALKIGVIALKTVGNAERVDFVEKCFDAMLHDFGAKMDDAFGDRGKVKELANEYFGENGAMKRMMEKTFGDDGQVSRHMERLFGQDGVIMKEMFDPYKPGTPLAKIKVEIESQFEKLRKDLAIAETREEIGNKTPIKGKVFEDEFEEMINRLAEHHGDVVERTGDQPGRLAPSKKGDFVISLANNRDQRIVFETKDKDTINFPSMERELNEAMENRDASYGVFVAKYASSLPKNVGWFNEYNGNMLVFALGEDEGVELAEEILKIGYKWARLRLLSGKGRELDGIDAKLIHDKIEEVGRRLKGLSTVKSNCTKAAENIQTIRDTIEEAITSIRGLLDEVLGEVDRAGRTTGEA